MKKYIKSEESSLASFVSNEYHFAVYKYNLVIGVDRLITRKFIVIKDSMNDIVCFTRLHEYVHSKRRNGAKSISDDGNNRFFFVTAFLNYMLFEKYEQFHFKCISDFTHESIQSFFDNYGSLDQDGNGRTKSTVDQCAAAVVDFLANYVKINNKRCILKFSDIVIEENVRSNRGKYKKVYIPNFDLIYSGKPKTIFRDMPNSVFELILSYIAEKHTDLLMLVALSAFAGLRPAEACNVRQEISPLGAGIRFSRINHQVKSVSIDLTEEKVLRSDLKSVGRIKKERTQKVYPKFIGAFMFCYKRYLEYLSSVSFEKDYCPLSIISNGKARTYASYYSQFRNVIHEMIPIMLRSDNPEINEYGNLLLSNNISPHIFRHWFSVRLTLYGEDIAGLQYWRGDKSPESALTYLQNKGELIRQLERVSNESFDFMMQMGRRGAYDNE